MAEVSPPNKIVRSDSESYAIAGPSLGDGPVVARGVQESFAKSYDHVSPVLNPPEDGYITMPPKRMTRSARESYTIPNPHRGAGLFGGALGVHSFESNA